MAAIIIHGEISHKAMTANCDMQVSFWYEEPGRYFRNTDSELRNVNLVLISGINHFLIASRGGQLNRNVTAYPRPLAHAIVRTVLVHP